MRRVFAFVSWFTILAAAAGAQDARVNENTAIYVNPSPAPNATPLRVAATGTILRVVGEEGDWLRVEFQDPRWGLRTGWVKASNVTVSRPELQPMDLSIRDVPAITATERDDDSRVPPPSRSSTAYRSHIVGRSGVTFGTETAVLFGVEASGDVLPMLGVYGSFDWHQNVAPTWLQDAADIIGAIADADLALKVPAYVGMGGVKVQVPGRVLRPYGVAGFGVGRIHGTIDIEGDDVTDLFDELGYLDKHDLQATRPLFEVGGGLAIAAGRGYIDASYRFRKFINVGEPINMSGVYVGGGVSF